ncbi:MAG: four-carbon acid sugar kinase family protein [Betaproteobacteria bacterium]
MVRLFAVADDLTGANATGALLTLQGLRVATLRPEGLEKLPGVPQYDAVIVSSNSRALPADEAYARVRACFARLGDGGASHFSKRIDTTLRGNVAVEIDAALDELTDMEMAVVVPAFPKSGRITVGGYQLVDGVALEKTSVARDPRTPVSKSHVPTLIQEGTRRKVASIPLGDVLCGWERVFECLSEARSCGAQIVVVDATTDEEIETIARAVSRLPFRVLLVDPGAFTASTVLASRDVASTTGAGSVSGPAGRQGRVALAIVGSATSLTRAQIKRLAETLPAVLVPVNATALAVGDPAFLDTIVAEAAKKVLDAVSARRAQDVVIVVTSSSTQEDTLDLTDLDRKMDRATGTAATNLASGLGRIARAALEGAKDAICGLYVTGGDTTLAVLEEVGAAGIEIATEVLPLAASGTVIGGRHEGVRLVTKGGLVGGEDAAVQCVCHLLERGGGGRE